MFGSGDFPTIGCCGLRGGDFPTKDIAPHLGDGLVIDIGDLRDLAIRPLRPLLVAEQLFDGAPFVRLSSSQTMAGIRADTVQHRVTGGAFMDFGIDLGPPDLLGGQTAVKAVRKPIGLAIEIGDHGREDGSIDHVLGVVENGLFHDFGAHLGTAVADIGKGDRSILVHVGLFLAALML